MNGLVFSAAVIAYINGLFGDFAFDDVFAVSRNSDVIEGTQILPLGHSLWRHDFWGQNIRSSTSHKSYRPITVLIFRVIRILGQILSGQSEPKAFWFRFINIFIHGVNSVLIYRLSVQLSLLCFLKQEEHRFVRASSADQSFDSSQARRFGLRNRKTERKVIEPKQLELDIMSADKRVNIEALFAGLLFAVHPIHTEAVTGIVGQAELLAALLSLLALNIFIKTYEMRNKSWSSLAIILMLVFLAALSKETGITAVRRTIYVLILLSSYVFHQMGSLFLFELFLPRTKSKRSLIKLSSFVFTVVAYAQLRKWIAGDHIVKLRGKIENPIPFADSYKTKILTLLFYHAKYASLLIFPLHLSADWSFECIPYVKSFFDPRNLQTVLLYSSLVIIVIAGQPWRIFQSEKCLSESRWRMLCVTALMICPFMPSSNVFFYVGTTIGERLLYFPSIGFCLLLGRMIDKWIHKQPNNKGTTSTRKKLASILVLILLFLTWSRNRDWQNEETLFASALKVCPKSAKVHVNCGILCRRKLDYSKALYHFKMAENIESSYCVTDYWIGLTLLDQGKMNEGFKSMKLALECEIIQARTLQSLMKFHESLLSTNLKTGNVMLAQWAEVMLHPSATLLYQRCAILEQSTIKAKHVNHTTFFYSTLQKAVACIPLLKFYDPELKAVQESDNNHVLENFLICMKVRLSMVFCMDSPWSQSCQFGIYEYLRSLSETCRTISHRYVGLPNVHMSFIHGFQMRNSKDPWLQTEWGKILETNKKYTEAAELYYIAGFLFIVNLEKQKTSIETEVLYNLHQPTNKRMFLWNENDFKDEKFTEDTKFIKRHEVPVFHILDDADCKNFAFESFRIANELDSSLTFSPLESRNQKEDILSNDHQSKMSITSLRGYPRVVSVAFTRSLGTRYFSPNSKNFHKSHSFGSLPFQHHYKRVVARNPYVSFMRQFLENQFLKVYFRFLPTAHSSMATSVVSVTPELEVVRIPCLSDNYAWLLHEPKSKLTAVVDPSESQPVIQALKEKEYELNYILNTHHHWDHTGGNLELKSKCNCTIVGPEADQGRIPGIDIALKDGDQWNFGDLKMMVFDTPGHTRGHITLYFPEASSLFPGDTLFLLGCGRVFEGTMDQMWNSLSKLKVLPPETKVYCGHEYTQANARFATVAEPNNAAIAQRKEAIDEMRSNGLPTVPGTLAEELETNPFLRVQDVASFAKLRQAKDNF